MRAGGPVDESSAVDSERGTMPRKPQDADRAAELDEPLLAVVGARIRSARKRAKLNQTQVAAAIGAAQSSIVEIEAGRQNLTLRMLARVAAALSVSPVTLLLEGDLARAADAGALDQIAADHGKLSQIGHILSTAVQHADQTIISVRQAYALTVTHPPDPSDATTASGIGGNR